VVLAAKLLAVESQLAACKQRIDSKKRRRIRFTASFRLLWVVLSKFLDEWEGLACLMQPATVKKWHTTAFRYFWRWKSRRKGGRPPISKEMQNLIYKLSKGQLGYVLKAEKQYEDLYNQIKRWTWRGRPTRKARKLHILEQKMNRAVSLSKMLLD